jgi:pimeloyl-ACP methyl ester carboxylesterase
MPILAPDQPGDCMRTKQYPLIALYAGVLALVSSCSTVPTHGRVQSESTAIAYFAQQRQGPTVVFQSGLGDGKDVWGQVIERMPDTVTVVAYDRPGYGDSPGTDEARDPCAISRELHTLLETAGLAPPYILVGHSLGGLYQFCYSKLFPDEVAGLVLLDPTHPDHWARMKEEAAVQAGLVKSLRAVAFSAAMRREFDDQEGCLAELEIGNRRRVPARLLFSGKFRVEEKGAFERMVRELRKQWELVLDGEQSSEVRNSGHYIQKEAPDAVATAIRSVVAEVASQSSRTSRL